MGEIEKLYELAGVETKEYCDRDSDACMSCCPEWENRQDCWKYKSVIPPFTAEKQLKILCFIVNNKHSVTFHDQIFSGDKLTLEKIQENLAWAINRIWQELTEKEKQQVKGILE